MPTWLHVQVQRILQILLVELGYRSGAELELRLDPNYGPIPDVVGLEAPPAGPYPYESRLRAVIKFYRPMINSPAFSANAVYM